jgi:plastocyanin
VTSTQVPPGATPFDSGDLVRNATFIRTFTDTGTYTYRCDNHPSEMRDATVIVT